MEYKGENNNEIDLYIIFSHFYPILAISRPNSGSILH